MAKARKVRVLTGSGSFVSPNEIDVAGPDGNKRVRFRASASSPRVRSR